MLLFPKTNRIIECVYVCMCVCVCVCALLYLCIIDICRFEELHKDKTDIRYKKREGKQKSMIRYISSI